MTVLVTGAAGFIGSHVARALLARGEKVVGIDNFSEYYDPILKFARLKPLRDDRGFTFVEGDVTDRDVMADLAAKNLDIDRVIHLAAQPGVGHSAVDPFAYLQANMLGHLVMLEMARAMKKLKHFVYASSSSVYGANPLPFSVADRVDTPTSFYAATKRSAELMSESYARQHALKLTGLRYFTVYGPWGRPDMSPYMFAKAIHEGQKIKLSHLGFAKRDYSYIDDIVEGTLAILDWPSQEPGHRLYNLGAARSEDVLRVISLFEKLFEKEAKIELRQAEPGDLLQTAADISETTRDFDWKPKVTVDEGIPKFVEWFKKYNRL